MKAAMTSADVVVEELSGKMLAIEYRVPRRDAIYVAVVGRGRLTADAGGPTPNGYRLEIACPCAVTFERLTKQDAIDDLSAST
ncbi:MAG: hypothetical protein DMD91_09955 [Candidatus Rokuibacteriota bacterium]|nr:MAG: hypothetical protein DMD91_09955 [Candidatus Rokubacteria bacterium]